MKRYAAVSALALAWLAAGCATPEPRDLSAFETSNPRSILVLPPLNRSPDLTATAGYLSTVTRPLAERGYYVFPVAVVDALMKANGLPTADEMHQVPLARLAEVTGADAVLYPTVLEYGDRFQILSSVAQVSVDARLVDARTGVTIWSGSGTASDSAGATQGKFVERLISAMISQALASTTDRSRPLAERVNARMLASEDQGLPRGPLDSRPEPAR